MTLYYILDPMCSWCYGFRAVFTQLCEKLPGEIDLSYVMGGLAVDSDEPMPGETRQYVQSQWRLVTKKTGATFNWDFWTHCQPRRSTYPACRAVLAARQQNPDYQLPMIHAIQDAYYQHARNPSDDSTLIRLAEALGLDAAKFTMDLNSDRIEKKLQADFQQRSHLSVTSFPSLRLQHNGRVQPIKVNYNNPDEMLQAISDSM